MGLIAGFGWKRRYYQQLKQSGDPELMRRAQDFKALFDQNLGTGRHINWDR